MLVGRTLAYHGVNYGGVSVQGLPLNQEGWGELLGPVAQIDHDDLTGAEGLFDQHGGEIAAVIAEPVIGAGGVHPPSATTSGAAEALRRGRRAAHLRRGHHRLRPARVWFAAEHYGVTPDLITFAKAVTSGYQPLGGSSSAPVARYRGRPGVHPASRLHLQRPPDGLRRGAGQLGILPTRACSIGSRLAERSAPALGAPARPGAGRRRCGVRVPSGPWPCPRGQRLRRAPGPARSRRDRPPDRRRGHRLLPTARDRRRRLGSLLRRLAGALVDAGAVRFVASAVSRPPRRCPSRR